MMSHDGNWQGQMIGRYQCLRRLGQGGMGEVWLAIDTQLQRQVALKLLPAVLVKDRKYLSAFANEAQASAALEHPHILSIHDFGEHETADEEIIPYLVMPYVDGGTLQARINQASGKLAVERSLYYLKQAAMAIDYAHSKNVLHRDIKPANMLLQQDWLLLSDFGIAKILSEITQRDQTQRGAGTPEFMAPEQIAGHAEAASDRYSLAVIAYQLFAGRLPLRGGTAQETYELQMRQEPAAPRQFNPAIPQDVEQILLQGLAKQPQKRPASCIAFVEALENGWKDSLPVAKDPDATALSPWSRRWQEAVQDFPGDNDPYGLAVATPVYQTPEIVSTIVRTEGSSQHPVTELPATQLASAAVVPMETATETPEPPAKKPGRRAVLIGGIIAGAAVIAGGAVAADVIYNTYFKTPAGPQNLVPGVPVLSLTGHTGAVWMSRWDPTGRYLLTCGDGADVMLWDIQAALQGHTSVQTQNKPLRKFNIANIDYKSAINEMCWTPDGKNVIATGNLGNKIYLVDPFNTGTPVVYSDLDAVDLGATLAYGTVCTGPQQDTFTVAVGNKAQIWRMGQTDQPIAQLRSNLGEFNYTSAMNWSHDGSNLAALSGDTTQQLIFWLNKERALGKVFDLPPRNAHIAKFTLGSTIAWSPVDANLLLLTLADLGVLWDATKNKALFGMGLGAKTDITAPAMSGMSWSPNGRYVIGSYDILGDGVFNIDQPLTPKIYIWDINKVQQGNHKEVQPPLLSFGDTSSVTHTASIVDIQWSPDGRYVSTASVDHKVIIWKVDGA